MNNKKKHRLSIFQSIIVLLLALLSVRSVEGLEIALKEGLKLYDASNKSQWCKLNAHLKLDETWSARYTPTVLSQRYTLAHSRIRNLELSVAAAITKQYSYLIKFDFAGAQKVLDAYLKFSGLGENTSLLIGQIPVPYGLENACSSKWGSFLEKPLPVSTFASFYGLGLYGSYHWNRMMISASVTQHPRGYRAAQGYMTEAFQGAMRVVFSPIHTPTQVYHFGLSARHCEVGPALVLLARPEARGTLPAFLRTPRISAKFAHFYGVEAAVLQGPWTIQYESMMAHIRQARGPANLTFWGWYAQASYILTGESRHYSFKMRTFGRIDPKGPKGAWEVAVRYSHLNLSSQNIKGGSEDNLAISLGWYATHHIRVLGNYIQAYIRESVGQRKKLDIVGLRLQLVY